MKNYKIEDYKDDIDNYDKVVRITDFEHFFSVHEDKKRDYLAYNLNATLYIEADSSTLPYIVMQHLAFWPQLSYQIYSTPRLAWLLMKLNNVKAEDMFKPVLPGTEVKYIDTDTMQDIIQKIN